jgi:hypothetical protein
LLGSLVKPLNPLNGLASLDLKSRCPARALLVKDALGLTDGGNGLRITHFRFLEVPCHSIITAPGHYTQHTHNQVLPFKCVRLSLIPASGTGMQHTLIAALARQMTGWSCPAIKGRGPSYVSLLNGIFTCLRLAIIVPRRLFGEALGGPALLLWGALADL